MYKSSCFTVFAHPKCGDEENIFNEKEVAVRWRKLHSDELISFALHLM
jgi:hypothetical protein